MRFSNTDLAPTLAIVGGGVFGVLIFGSFLFLLSPSNDVPAPDPVVASLATANSTVGRLEQAQRRLVSAAVEEARVRAADLAREQRDIEVEMDRLREASGGPGSEAGRRILDRKEAMQDEIADLEREIDRLTRDAPTNQREMLNRLREAATTIRDDRLKERIRYSRGLIGVRDREFTREFEAETTRVLEELQEELQRASDTAELAAPAQSGAQEISPEDLAAIQAGPVFTPMTVRPEILNRDEIIPTLIQNYPPDLRDAGIGGQVAVWFYISDTGNVLHTRISQSSGHDGLDAAALRVANVYEFTPALNRDQRVKVWIQIPITFQVR